MEYKCKVCIKNYSSYQSLWNHINRYHKNPVYKNDDNVIISAYKNDNTNKIDNTACKYCNKILSSRQGRWRHEQKCKIKNNNIDIKQELDKVKQELAILKETKGNIITTNNNNNNNNTTNNIMNIIKFGSEDVMSILNKKQKKNILNSRLLAIETMIKEIHFNKERPDCQNIKISNLRSNIAKVYDGEKFKVVNQYATINEMIDNYVEKISELLDEYKDKLTEGTINRLYQLFEKLDNEDIKLLDDSTNRSFKNFKDYKIDSVKHMIYNESNDKKTDK